MPNKLPGFQPDCKTTAMSILPHKDVNRALDLVLSLDIPFWPQLPRNSFYQDMYAQASYDFPGIIIDRESEKISFSAAKFESELNDYSRKMLRPEGLALSQSYADIYQEFLGRDLHKYAAIHGQVTGPVNLGFRIHDEDSKPIIYNDDVRGLLFDFIQRKFNNQLRQMQERNENAFVWLDEPGLVWVFSGLAGYSDVQAKREYQPFLAGLNGLKALHLCTNINLPYQLGLGIEFLSFDAHQMELMPAAYAASIAGFIGKGGIISWGIVPTEPASLTRETPETLARLLIDYWEIVSRNTGLDAKHIASQSLIAPAKCCVKSLEFNSANVKTDCTTAERPGLTAEEESVEKAYGYLKTVSNILKAKYNL